MLLIKRPSILLKSTLTMSPTRMEISLLMCMNPKLSNLSTIQTELNKENWDSLENNCKYTTNWQRSNFSKKCTIIQLWLMLMSKFLGNNIWSKLLLMINLTKWLLLVCLPLSGQWLTLFQRLWNQWVAPSSLLLTWPLISKLLSHLL